MKNPVIVIIAFNRPNSLSQLLKSLKNSYYESQPKLIISIDFSINYQNFIVQLAEEFSWKGEKKIIAHNSHLGLKKHVMFCGELTKLFSSLIILEDDICVAPGFYQFAVKSINTFKRQKNISGISLYSHTYSESTNFVFEPIKCTGDYFLMQMPSSWGLVITEENWGQFMTWSKSNPAINNESILPRSIKEWSGTSWKKLFLVYMIHNNKYFAYPYFSYAANLNKPGTNVKKHEFHFTNSLSLDNDPNLNSNGENQLKYNPNCNLSRESLVKYVPELSKYFFEMDLFGDNLHYTNYEYIMTCLPSKNEIVSFGLELKPIELNIIRRVPGTDIKLVHKNDILSQRIPDKIMKYKYPIARWNLAYFQESVLTNITNKLNHIIRVFNANHPIHHKL